MSARLDVGGKLLTNQLKELVSFRQWNMMDETYIMNHVKETCCYVSTQFGKDLDICRYVLFSMYICIDHPHIDDGRNEGVTRRPIQSFRNTSYPISRQTARGEYGIRTTLLLKRIRFC